MEQNNVIPLTPACAVHLRALKLLAQKAPGNANWLSWSLQLQYLNLSLAQRPKTFSEYIIQELSK